MTVVPLHADNPGPMTGAGNWTYLVPGRSAVLIDAGVGRAAHLEALSAHVPDGPALVVVTHAHPDHISGAPALATRWPAARFAKLPWPRCDGTMPWEALADGDVVPTGEGDLLVVHTPGHAPDHIALWHAASRTVFTGDLLVKGGSVVIPASAGGVLADYLRSLERLAALPIRRALPGHGPAIDDPLSLIAQYLAHRREREAQVLEALGTQPLSVAAIATRIYTGLDPALVPQAQDSVLAHLVKLEGEGVALRDGAGWRRHA